MMNHRATSSLHLRIINIKFIAISGRAGGGTQQAAMETETRSAGSMSKTKYD